MGVRKRGKILHIDFACHLPSGKRVRCVESTRLTDTKANRKRAKDKFKAIKYHLEAGTFKYLDFFPHGSKARHFTNPGSKLTFGEWWKRWVGLKTLAPSTDGNYRRRYKTHIEPFFAHRPLCDITEDDLLIFRKGMESKKLKASTINRTFGQVRWCLQKAYKKGLISQDITIDVKPLKELLPDIEPLSFDELKHLLDYLEENRPALYDLVFFWSRTGLRPGELIGLKWEDIDWHNSKLLIRRSLCSISRKLKGPKTGYRDISLRPSAIECLKRQKERTFLEGNFIWKDGEENLTHYRLKRTWKHVLKLAEILYRPPKQMRHTFATLHLASGEFIAWVSQVLGHASIETTLKRYTRFVPNLTHSDGDLFEKVMGEDERVTKLLHSKLTKS